MTLHEHVVAAVAAQQGLAPDSEEFAAFLKTLQRSLLRLRKSYHASVTIPPYEESHVRLAYVLTYYSTYAGALPYALETLVKLGWSHARSPLRLLSFGTGPGSEISGWIRHLARTSGHLPAVTCVMNDRRNDVWQPVRQSILRRVVADYHQGQQPDFRSRQMNFCQPLDAVTLELAANSQLILFQNCLNEVPVASHRFFLDNLEGLIRAMPPGALLMVLDLQKYTNIDSLLKKARHRMYDVSGLERSPDCYLESPPTEPVPGVLREHFFRDDGGLHPCGSMKFRVLACMKRRETQRNGPATMDVLDRLIAEPK